MINIIIATPLPSSPFINWPNPGMKNDKKARNPYLCAM